MAPRQSSRGLPTADLSTALRSGRDDKGEGGYGPRQSSRGLPTADLSTALRSGRDDKGQPANLAPRPMHTLNLKSPARVLLEPLGSAALRQEKGRNG
jgi:hypothetical protein